ncbi:MAG TPA: hypothetical protein VGE26_03110 [Sphingobacteriaceae bacterium]
MNKQCILFPSIMLGIMSASNGQTSPCDDRVIKHRSWTQSDTTQWNFQMKSSGKGELVYFGASHEDDPHHEQFAEITKKWNKFTPTIAFFEGPDRGIGSDDSSTIRKFGESGYVRFLATKAGIRSITLEPAFANTYQHLIAHFPQEQVDIYMMTKEAMRLRTRKGFSEEQLASELTKMLNVLPNMLGNVKLSINSVDELNTAFTKYWGNKLEWWQAPQEWFDPVKRSADTGGIFTNEINTLSSDYRDIFMYKVIAEYVNKGEKVFAVVGRNHVPLQKPALQCAIK